MVTNLEELSTDRTPHVTHVNSLATTRNSAMFQKISCFASTAKRKVFTIQILTAKDKLIRQQRKINLIKRMKDHAPKTDQRRILPKNPQRDPTPCRSDEDEITLYNDIPVTSPSLV